MTYDLTKKSDRLSLYKRVLKDYEEAIDQGIRPKSMNFGLCEHILRQRYTDIGDSFDVFHRLVELDQYLPPTELYIALPGQLEPRIKILKEIIQKM
jgi:hypothetical protein